MFLEKKTPLFSIYHNIFSLSTFLQRFDSGLPQQYLENKNHETIFDSFGLSGNS